MPIAPTSLAAAAALLVAALPDVQVVYCFGSVARGDDHAESDVDLAVLAGRRIEPLERLDLVARLSALVGREVDLVDLRSAPTTVKAQAIDGLVLHERSRETREYFEAITLSEYVQLNERRAGILADVYARGSVRGK